MTTPARIRQEIIKALQEDFKRHPYGSEEPFIPARTFSVIDEAIKRACEEERTAA